MEDGIDPEPGQPGLRLRDTLVEVNGTSLMELSDQERRGGEPGVSIESLLHGSQGVTIRLSQAHGKGNTR